MASSSGKNPCAKCSKGAGIATCDGCHLSFCRKHFDDHRKELSQDIDLIGQSRDVLRRDMSEKTTEHPILTHIDIWERESISKIQAAADTARADLRQLLYWKKDELNKSVETMTDELQLCRESDDYTENDLKRWTEQLNELRRTFESLLNVDLKYDSHAESAISLLKVCNQQERKFLPPVTTIAENSHSFEESNLSHDEKFLNDDSEVVLSENDRTATCRSKASTLDGMVYCFKLYNSGIHNIRFRIEKRKIARMFFGIFSSSKKCVESISLHGNNSVYGWWDTGVLVKNGFDEKTAKEYIIITGDEMTLTLDCDHRQIQLYHLRLNRQVQLPIELAKCPFPWKIVVKLTSNGDCARILQ